MAYPARLSDDLKYLSAWYRWNDEDKKEVRAAFTGCNVMVNFFMALAAAHRAGYNAPAGKSFQTLKTWCLENSVEDPFKEGFNMDDLKQLDELSA